MYIYNVCNRFAILRMFYSFFVFVVTLNIK